jgi:hypothetical protein
MFKIQKLILYVLRLIKYYWIVKEVNFPILTALREQEINSFVMRLPQRSFVNKEDQRYKIMGTQESIRGWC